MSSWTLLASTANRPCRLIIKIQPIPAGLLLPGEYLPHYSKEVNKKLNSGKAVFSGPER
jgi:hypothetical protein